MELGISTFREVHPDHKAGNAVNAHQRVQQLLEEVKLADEVAHHPQRIRYRQICLIYLY